ncbi:MAG TPA: tetratricopeptide repeat protein [Candidatus Limnocylindria bacterium]|nr:tetratricopeptide repeat protein [Candidatus Limnocylindria bacterium]
MILQRLLLLTTCTCLCFPLATGQACIWDAQTKLSEKISRPDLVKAIRGETGAKVDVWGLQRKIERLRTSPRENDVAWWNDLAGTHLRLGEAQKAATLLEQTVARFPDDYGVHANLGTAYHLLGRYADAEKEIARDLEINPNAHFGLERYHLALLQYLMRDTKYQARHVYVDEWSERFLHRGTWLSNPGGKLSSTSTEPPDAAERIELEAMLRAESTEDFAVELIAQQLAASDTPPSYRLKWDLAADPKFEEGIFYMASLNPREPACFVMLGVDCLKNRKYNLAVESFEKAIRLGSPQARLLQLKIPRLQEYIRKSHQENRRPYLLLVAVSAVIALYVILRIRSARRKRAAANQPSANS